MPWHLQTIEKTNLEISLSNMGPVRSVVAEHYKQLPPVWWKEPKKHDLRATLLQSRNPPLARGQTCGLKQALPNNAKTICLRVPYLMHWCFLQFEVPEMMWVQLIKHGVFIYRHTWGRYWVLPVLWHSMRSCGWPCKVQEEDGHTDPEMPPSHACYLQEVICGENHL